MNIACALWGHQLTWKKQIEDYTVPLARRLHEIKTREDVESVVFGGPLVIQRSWAVTSCKRCHRGFGSIREGEEWPEALIGIPLFHRVMRGIWCQVNGHQDELDPTVLQYRCACGNWGRTVKQVRYGYDR